MFLCNAAFSQSSVVKINIFSPVVRTFNVAYEQAINESGSFQLGFFYTGYKKSGTGFSGFGITPEYRFYLSDSPAPDGFYAAPFVRYMSFSLTESSTNDEADFSAFGGGLVIGRQWIFKKRISLDIFIGPAYYSGNVKAKDGASASEFNVDAFNGFGVRTGLTFGIAF